MWKSRSKLDLMIEVWEKLDCETVGRIEIEAIEEAVAGRFGRSAVDSPMVIARTLADEGAQLRHSEIMRLYLERADDRPFDASLRNLFNTETLAAAEKSLRDAENLRRKYAADKEKEGLRLLKKLVVEERVACVGRSTNQKISDERRAVANEIAGWLKIWLETPEIFENWLAIRKSSAEYRERFEADDKK
jgi:hypothetical protein